MVALHATIHDCCISLLPDPFFRNFMIDPIRVSPHRRIYFAELDWRACMVPNRFFERRIKVAIIEEDVGVVEPPIEMPFHRFYGLDHTF